MPDEYYAEPAEDEIFDGPTHEQVPSSYSSYHHHPMSYRSGFARRGSGDSHTSSFSAASDGDSRRDSFASFQYFSRNELMQAEGASTVAGDDEDPHNEQAVEEPAPPHDYDYYGDSDSAHEPLLSGEDTFAYSGTRQFQKYYISEEDMRIVCAGYRRSTVGFYLYLLFCIVTCGLGFLLLRWFPRWRIAFIATECPLCNCDLMVVENQWGELEMLEVHSERYGFSLSTIFNTENPDVVPPQAEGGQYVDKDPNVPLLKSTTYRYIKFIYNPVTDLFMTNSDWANAQWDTNTKAREGLSTEQQSQREMVFGKNTLEIHQPSLAKLLVDEVLHPFYIFQVFSIILWSFDDYTYYATAIFIVSISSVAEALVATRKSFQRLEEIAFQDIEIRVQRSGFWNTIHSSDLVPGDVYELSDPSLSTLPCDSVLLSGDCIVNESILTGESVPVSKLPAADEQLERLVYDGPSAVAKNFLYCGTRIIRVRKPGGGDDFEVALAMAVRTGFNTTKGALLRSMMFPKPSGFKFYRDSFRYIGVMAIIAMMGFAVSAYSFIKQHMPYKLIVLRALDLITIVVPPALPATLTIGTNISLARLRKKDIFCITPSRVNVGGRIDVCCFDKTGTLTEDGLDVLGVHTCPNGRFSDLLTNVKQISQGPLLETLATCHELRVVDRELVGDPLDIKMFEFCQWKFEEDERNGRRLSWQTDKSKGVSVAKQFDFMSQLRRASVVVSGGEGTRVLVKGAPEVMQEICRAETLPDNLNELLHEYTHRGYRVIACAWRTLDEISDYTREDLEADLDFAGLIIFENKLKPITARVIHELENANFRTLMCTGDNLLTAICVGRECGIIPGGTRVYAPHFSDSDNLVKWECVDDSRLMLDANTLKPLDHEEYTLAVTGQGFRFLLECGTTEQLHQMLVKTSIYARMSPDEKHELINQMQKIDYTTCFCGDGANDCGALKEADVGISLSEAEASVAAPFTSRVFDISCVPMVIREGRCALNTSFSCFKYMSMYSAIQFVTVTILYGYGTNIGDFQFLWIDLFLIVPLAVFMAWSEPSPILTKKRPGAELVSRKVLVPLVGMILVVFVFQVVVWRYAQAQPWYIAPEYGNNDNLKSTDNTALFEISSFQYIFVAVLLSEGLPFRQPIWKNTPFLITTGVCLALTMLFIFLNPDTWLGDLMDMSPTSTSFKFFVLAVAAVNWMVMAAANRWAWPPICRAIKWAKHRAYKRKQPKTYKKLTQTYTV